MPDKHPPIVRKASRVDPRVARSTHQLGSALIELMQEREFDQITVQDILQRAGVGRATFYAHYRNKHDVLHSSYERLFIMLERMLTARPRLANNANVLRIVPVTEFCAHIADSAAVVSALHNSGQMDEMLELSVGFIATMIERRIVPRATAPLSRASVMPPALVARMLAAAFLEMVKWWIDHQSTSSPARMDFAFHEIAHVSLQSASYEMAREVSPLS